MPQSSTKLLSPPDILLYSKRKREHGTALTKDEEKKLFIETAGTPYKQMFAVGLYANLRPNEDCTRCTECGIAEAAIKKHVGHALGGLVDTYTDLCDKLKLTVVRKFAY